MSQFWMVYGIGCSRPTFQHTTVESATAEASRLARLAPGTTFVVLEAIKAVSKRDVDVVALRPGDEGHAGGIGDDGIPF